MNQVPSGVAAQKARRGSGAGERGRRGLLALAGVALACLISELVLRTTGLGTQFFQPDARLGYVLAPHASRRIPTLEHPDGTIVIRTNNLGLRRDTDTAQRKPAATYRILLLGDSQTEGIVTNAETYAARIEAALPAQLGGSTVADRIEVLNGAVSGYSPLLEYLAFTERAPVLQPDLALLAIYVGNDVAELDARHADFGGLGPIFKLPFLEDRGMGWEVQPPGSDGGVLSRFDWYLRAHVRMYALVRRLTKPAAAPPGGLMAKVVSTCLGCGQSIWQAAAAHGDPAGLQSGFSKLEYVLRLWARAAAQLQMPLLVAVIPTKPEVEYSVVAADVAAAATTLGLPGDPRAFDRAVREHILTLCDRLGIERIDLLAALQTAFQRDGRPLYWNLDWHLNVDGHRVVADALVPVLAPHVRRAPPP